MNKKRGTYEAPPEAILPLKYHQKCLKMAQEEERLPPNIPEDNPLNDVQHESMMIDQTPQQQQDQFQTESRIEPQVQQEDVVQSVQSGEDIDQMMMMLEGRNITDIMDRIEEQQAVEQQVDMRAMHPNNNNNNNVDASLAAPQDIKEQLPEPMDTNNAEMYNKQIHHDTDE
eukprot:89514_1